MSPDDLHPPEMVTADFTLSSADWRMDVKIDVPTAPTRMIELLPIVHTLADRVVDEAARRVEDEGEKVSCKKGCGACCRQLVPIAEVEGRHIRDLVKGLPEPRRAEIRSRFAAARRRLADSGLLEKLLYREDWAAGESKRIGMEYFRLGIACPFLEDESCSIHLDRPVACREYLVTSPSEHCSRPTPETVKAVRLPLKVWTSVARMDELPPGARSVHWVPLILAPEWAEGHPDESIPRPGPELIHRLAENFARRETPSNIPSQAPYAMTDAPTTPAVGF